jgi:hypothetical protein
MPLLDLGNYRPRNRIVINWKRIGEIILYALITWIVVFLAAYGAFRLLIEGRIF